MEHRPFLGLVDRIPGEHASDPIADPTLVAQLREQRDRLVGDAVLRKVEEKVAERERKTRGAIGVLVEEVAHLEVGDLVVMGAQRLPCSSPCRVDHRPNGNPVAP
jgi:hypothetical protein